MENIYYIYMLRCEDKSIYTGITTDIDRRLNEHFTKDEKKCAKYTKRHTAKNVEAVWQTENRVLASKLEYHIKKLTKSKKEQLVETKCLNDVLSEYIDSDKYKVFNIKGRNSYGKI